MSRPPRVVLLLALWGCAPAMSAAEHDAPYLSARASETGACDAACCERMAAGLATARAEGDDRLADDFVDRLALSCPDRRRGLLDPSLEPKSERPRERLMI